MSDLIERDKAINRIDEWYGDEYYTPAIISVIEDIPTIATKQIKYYDEDEQVWKTGSVIVDE